MKEAKLRLWPGLAAGAVIVVGFVVGILFNLELPDTGAFWILGAILGALAVVVWWFFFSRAQRSERWGALGLLIVAWFAMRPFLDPSITGGAMGALPVAAFPVLAVALVVWAVVTRNLSGRVRPVSLVAAVLIACVPATLVRTEGIRGGFFELHWRWTPTPEDLLLVNENADLPPVPPAPAAKATIEEVAAVPLPLPTPIEPADWPGFRGPGRDGIVHDVKIETDWSNSPPVELWRRPIGPGWSSFAVAGDLLYTQEQRGDDEIVSSYRLSSGEPV